MKTNSILSDRVGGVAMTIAKMASEHSWDDVGLRIVDTPIPPVQNST
jgi:hypothetical protein